MTSWRGRAGTMPCDGRWCEGQVDKGHVDRGRTRSGRRIHLTDFVL